MLMVNIITYEAYELHIMSIYAIETLSDVHSILIYMPCCMYVHIVFIKYIMLIIVLRFKLALNYIYILCQLLEIDVLLGK